MRILMVVVVAGCGVAESPCDEPGACIGTVSVDLSGDAPVFVVEGAGEVVPDVLSVSRRTSCDGGETAWAIDRISDAEAPIVYGELPEGAKEQNEPIALEEGEDYDVVFSKGLGPNRSVENSLGSSRSEAVPGWSALFTWGDPDSVRTEDADCP